MTLANSRTISRHTGKPNALATTAVLRKMPTTMRPPMTAAVVEPRPSSRRKSLGEAGADHVTAPTLRIAAVQISGKREGRMK
jgi:hypothetical protein